MRYLRLTTVLAAAAAVMTPGALAAEPFGPWNFDPDQQVIHIGTSSGSYLGVNLREIDSDRAKELKLGEEAGVEITRVEEDSPAAKAGLKAGDVVLSYNGEHVEGMEQFSRFVRETPPGRAVKLVINRDGNTQTLVAKVGSRKGFAGFAPLPAMPRVELPAMAPMPDLPRTIMMWRTSVLGIEAEALRGQMADFFGVKEGVLVRSVMKDTPASRAGLKAGDVIVKVGDTRVATPSELSSAIRSLHEKRSFPVVVMRDHKETTLTASIEEDRSDGEMMAPRSPGGPGVKL